MLNTGQISFKHFSEKDILDKSKEKYEKQYNFKHLKVGKEQDVRLESIILASYLTYYKCFEEELKEKMREHITDSKCKSYNNVNKHHRHFQKENKECVTDKCDTNGMW